MATRAKFQVSERLETPSGYRVTLQPVTATSEENASFFKYTPTGKLEMGLVQQETAEQFTPGKQFYIDFTEAE